MHRVVWGVLGLVAALCSLSGANATSSEEARIPLDDTAQIWVQHHDGAWMHWISGAPDFVNRPFLDVYETTAPQASLPTAPVTHDWWTIEDNRAILAHDAPPVRAEGSIGASRARDSFILIVGCAPDLDVRLGFDQNGARPRQLRPDAYEIVRWNTIAGGRFAGQKTPVLEHRPNQVSADIRVDGEEFGSWWRLTPDYRWAIAPNPAELVEAMRGGLELAVEADEQSAYTAQGYAPLAGSDDVLARLPCVGAVP